MLLMAFLMILEDPVMAASSKWIAAGRRPRHSMMRIGIYDVAKVA
jgi:hypothetical protein